MIGLLKLCMLVKKIFQSSYNVFSCYKMYITYYFSSRNDWYIYIYIYIYVYVCVCVCVCVCVFHLPFQFLNS